MIKSFSKDIYNVLLILCSSFGLYIHQIKNVAFIKKYLPEKKLFSTLIKIRNVYRAANQYITIISDGSSDTENWDNDAEN